MAAISRDDFIDSLTKRGLKVVKSLSSGDLYTIKGPVSPGSIVVSIPDPVTDEVQDYVNRKFPPKKPKS